ncbi:uncharacterized protein LOC129750951 isoform X2 [Uranotaenia lowii]|uniref:uncharacterized protein LOC129750951 isoform X2 n=1 Tax=Uranotaenia lowii TaxID=190385 RepID=UPI00247945EC|nr:uncharacterized protein LOC129750951 isoform X2 [Uranotaenia lowii]
MYVIFPADELILFSYGIALPRVPPRPTLDNLKEPSVFVGNRPPTASNISSSGNTKEPAKIEVPRISSTKSASHSKPLEGKTSVNDFDSYTRVVGNEQAVLMKNVIETEDSNKPVDSCIPVPRSTIPPLSSTSPKVPTKAKENLKSRLHLNLGRLRPHSSVEQSETSRIREDLQIHVSNPIFTKENLRQRNYDAFFESGETIYLLKKKDTPLPLENIPVDAPSWECNTTSLSKINPSKKITSSGFGRETPQHRKEVIEGETYENSMNAKLNDSVDCKIMQTVVEFTAELALAYNQHAETLRLLVSNYKQMYNAIGQERSEWRRNYSEIWNGYLAEIEEDSRSAVNLAKALSNMVSFKEGSPTPDFLSETQEHGTWNQFDLRARKILKASEQTQRALLLGRIEPNSPIGSRKMSSSSSSSMKTKWLKAFRSLKPVVSTNERDKSHGGQARLENHNLVEYTYKKITPCDVCSQVLRGHTKQGLRCRICKINTHPDCASQLPKCQSKQKLLRRQKSTSEIRSFAVPEETPRSPRRQKLNLQMKSLSLESPHPSEMRKRNTTKIQDSSVSCTENWASYNRLPVSSSASGLQRKQFGSGKGRKSILVEVTDDNERNLSSETTSTCPSPVKMSQISEKNRQDVIQEV